MSKNKLKLSISSLIIALFCVLPFEYLLTLEIGSYTIKMSNIIILVLSALAVYNIFKRKIKLDLFDYLLLLFIDFTFLSSLWSINPQRTLLYSFFLLVIILSTIYLRNTLDSKLRRSFEKIIITLSIFLSLFALYQYFADLSGLPSFLREMYQKSIFGFARPQATFLEPLYFANFLLIPISIIIKRILEKENVKKSLATLILLLLAFFLTLSRGADLALVIMCLSLLLLIFVFDSQKIKIKNIIIIIGSILIGLALAILCSYLAIGKSGPKTYFNHAFSADDSINHQNQITSEKLKSRSYTKKIALNSIEQKPFGIGFSTFGTLPQFDLLKKQGDYQTVNNQYLEILVEIGYLGFVLFIALIIIMGIKSIKNLKQNNDILYYSAALIAIFTQYSTFSGLFLVYIWIIIAISTAKNNLK